MKRKRKNARHRLREIGKVEKQNQRKKIAKGYNSITNQGKKKNRNSRRKRKDNSNNSGQNMPMEAKKQGEKVQ